MHAQFAVIGLGVFGQSLAKALCELGSEVIAIDQKEENVKAISEHVTYAVVADAMDERAMRDVGLHNVDTAIVSIGENIEASILIVMVLKELGVKHIIAKALSSLHGKVLKSLNVKRVIYPERDMAVKLAQSLVKSTLIEHLEISDKYSIVEMPAPKALIGKSLLESKLRQDYRLNLIAIIRGKGKQKHYNINPLPTDVIKENDQLVLIGSNEDIQRLNEA